MLAAVPATGNSDEPDFSMELFAGADMFRDYGLRNGLVGLLIEVSGQIEAFQLEECAFIGDGLHEVNGR
jgi:hypothetical protein